MRDASEDEVKHLLDRWKRGDRDDSAWYRLLCGPMRRAAWRGIQRMIGRPPNDDDVGEVVHEAFIEFLGCGPRNVRSPVGLAARIAFRRGQDFGRKLNRRLEFPDSDAVVAESERDPPPGPEDEFLEAERAAERERMRTWALECMSGLTAGQAEVVRATILGQQNISDWAHEKGKKYQAADQQRKRALMTLLRCVKAKLETEGGDHVV